MSLLKCTALVKDYPGKRAVNGVDFHVERGEIVGLLGPNGAGKTTTFRMACGLISPTEGSVVLDGIDVTRWPMYRRARNGMGFLPQDNSIFGKLSVEQNIFAILEYLKLSRKERMAETDRLLSQFGLNTKRKQTSRTLSGGERRRLEIARCLASKPQLILLDEPFTGIDPVTIHSIQDIISELCDSGISILLTDHRERETLTITHRSYIICAGKVVANGDAQTVLSDPTAIELYFGTRFDAGSIIEGKEQFQHHQTGGTSRGSDVGAAASYDQQQYEHAHYEQPGSEVYESAPYYGGSAPAGEEYSSHPYDSRDQEEGYAADPRYAVGHHADLQGVEAGYEHDPHGTPRSYPIEGFTYDPPHSAHGTMISGEAAEERDHEEFPQQQQEQHGRHGWRHFPATEEDDRQQRRSAA